MNDNQVNEYIGGLSNIELLIIANQACDDLNEASKNHPESPRHEECFAAVILLAEELNKRKLKFSTVH